MQELCKLKSTSDEELDEGILINCKMKSSIVLPPPGTLSCADKKRCLKESDVVILKEDNPFRGTWRLEIVDSVEVSSDGLTRTVRLRMSTDRLTVKGGGQSRVPIDQFTSRS